MVITSNKHENNVPSRTRISSFTKVQVVMSLMTHSHMLEIVLGYWVQEGLFLAIYTLSKNSPKVLHLWILHNMWPKKSLKIPIVMQVLYSLEQLNRFLNSMIMKITYVYWNQLWRILHQNYSPALLKSIHLSTVLTLL